MGILYQNGAPATTRTLTAPDGSKIRREAALRAAQAGDEAVMTKFGLSLHVPPPPPEQEPEPEPEITDAERIEQAVGLPLSRIKEIILESEEQR